MQNFDFTTWIVKTDSGLLFDNTEKLRIVYTLFNLSLIIFYLI